MNPQSDSELEAELAEDRRVYGSAFWVSVNGRKVRVHPEKVFVDSETGRHFIDPDEALQYSAPVALGGQE